MRSRRNALLVPFVAVVVALVVAACGNGGTGKAPASGGASSGALTVVTTTTVLADIVRNVAGDRATVTSIIPSGVGPEDYEPKPQDARQLADADLIVTNGAGLDDFVDKLITAAGAKTSQRLVLADTIQPILVDGEPNPHFWLDPESGRGPLHPGHGGRPVEGRPGRRSDVRGEREQVCRLSPRHGQGERDKDRGAPGREPQARHVPRRVPLLRGALRLRAHRRDPRRTSARSRVRPTWPLSSRRSRRPASRLSSPRDSSIPSSHRPWPRRPASPRSFRLSTRTRSARPRTTRIFR